MTTKTTFDINSENITNGFQKVFTAIQDSRFKMAYKSGNTIVDIPLLFAILLAVIFPFMVIVAIVLTVVSSMKISIERKVNTPQNGRKMIDLQ